MDGDGCSCVHAPALAGAAPVDHALRVRWWLPWRKLGDGVVVAALAIEDLAAGFELTSLGSSDQPCSNWVNMLARVPWPRLSSGHVLPRMPTQSCGQCHPPN